MKDQVKYLSAEKQEIHRKIEIARRECDVLEKKLQNVKDEIEKRESIISDIDIQIEDLYDQMEELEHQIALKEEEIKNLQIELAQILNKRTPVKFSIYKPVKGDEVDLKLAEMINIHGSPVPWVRESSGNYKYGSKKVNVKYLRNNLIIKVGGGSMNFEEFVETYEDIELAKLNFQNPGAYVASSQLSGISGLSKQQRISIARGASPRGTTLGAGSPSQKRQTKIPLTRDDLRQ